MIYEYRCTTCGRVRQKEYRLATNPERVLCVACGDVAVRYMGNSNLSVQYRGTGWAGKGHGETHPSEVRSTDPFAFEGADKA